MENYISEALPNILEPDPKVAVFLGFLALTVYFTKDKYR